MSTGQRLALVGDIGGTYARFAISDVDDMTVTHFASLQTQLFPSVQGAIRDYLASLPFRPDMVGLAVAAPVSGDRVTMAAPSWSFTRADIEAATGASRVHLVNDFEALALMTPHLTPHDLEAIGVGIAVASAPRVVLGAGTGFGAACLVKTRSGWTALAGQGGGITFGAANDKEAAILHHLGKDGGHVPLQRVLSGRGLLSIYDILGGARRNVSAPEMVRLAEDRTDAVAQDALDQFIAILARIAGDMALMLDARGGVYLGGGIAPKMLERLKSGRFRKAFERKGSVSGYLSDIPVHVIKAPDAGLRGAALALSLAFEPDIGTAARSQPAATA